jgi:phage terminase large subunit-like protein
MAIGYNRYNALSSAQKWDKKFNTIQIRQHSDTLHSPTKLLYEKIMDRQFRYETNKLLEINFENARCTYDTNMNRYFTKKKKPGKSRYGCCIDKCCLSFTTRCISRLRRFLCSSN